MLYRMMSRLGPALGWSFLLVHAVSPVSFARTGDPSGVAISCPELSAVKEQRIPFSFNSVYSTAEERLNFLGLDIAGLPLAKMHFTHASVNSINNYWRIYCTYEDAMHVLVLSSQESALFEQCDFADQTRNCTESRSSCIITCPGVPRLHFVRDRF